MRSQEREELRAALIDPADVVEGLGLVGRRQSGGVMIRCPEHDDRRPSCSVTRGEGGTLRVHCFSCGFSGDVFALIAVVHGLDVRAQFREVLEYARELASDVKPRGAPTIKSVDLAPPHLSPPPEVTSVFEALLQATQLEGEVAEYVDARGLLAQAKLAGCRALPPESAQRHLVASLRRDHGQEAVCASGLVKGDVFVWSSHRLVVPWRRSDGTISTIQRRLFGAVGATAAPRYIFPRGWGAEEPYGSELLGPSAPASEVLLVEGVTDVLAARALPDADERVVIGVPGVSWRPARGWESIARGRRILIGFDSDQPGESAAHALAAVLYAAGATDVARARPAKKDWAELVEVAHRG